MLQRRQKGDKKEWGVAEFIGRICISRRTREEKKRVKRSWGRGGLGREGGLGGKGEERMLEEPLRETIKQIKMGKSLRKKKREEKEKRAE